MTRRGRRSAAAAAVAVFLLCDVIGFAWGRECTDFGCCYNKGHTHATQLTCNISIPSATIFLEEAPKLKDVKITQGHKIYFKGDFVATTNKLRSLLFSDIKELTLEANSKVQVGADRAVSLTVSRVGTLHIKTSAFLGWQSALANVSIGDTEIVHIDQHAFPDRSSFRRVRLFNITFLTLEMGAIRGTVGQLELKNIRFLQLTSGAIHGTVENLSLRNVNVWSCPPWAIGGSIGHVSLHSVTLFSLESRCLDASRGWLYLTLTNCHLGYMSQHSIHGVIGNVVISGCNITSAGPTAVSVSVVQLDLTTSAVGELGPWALQVRATSSVALRGVSVTHLRPNALSGLQINDTTTGGGISVSRLSVDHAEPGSLRFAEGAPVTLKNLLLSGSCVCSTPSWARQLLLGPSGGSEDGPSGDEGGPSSDGEDGPSGGGRDGLSSGSGLATERDTLLRQVEAGLCTVDGNNISLSHFTAQYCGGAGGVNGQPAGRSAPLAGWWFYLGVVALVALLLVVAVLLVIAAGKYRRHRQRKRPERPEPAGAAGGLCSAGGPADVGEQHGASPYCRPVLPSGPAEPEVLYSEVADRLSDDGQRIDKSPPAGGSRREPLCTSSPDLEQCSCPPTGLYAISAKIEERSCKPARLSAAVSSQTAGAAEPPGHPDIEVNNGRAAAKPGNQTGQISAECSEDLPDYAETSPRQCSEDLPDYAEISPRQCSEDLPDYAEISPRQCSEGIPDHAEISPRQCSEDLRDYDEISPRQCSEDLPDYAEISLGPPADLTGRVTSARMVDNELYGSTV